MSVNRRDGPELFYGEFKHKNLEYAYAKAKFIIESKINKILIDLSDTAYESDFVCIIYELVAFIQDATVEFEGASATVSINGYDVKFTNYDDRIVIENHSLEIKNSVDINITSISNVLRRFGLIDCEVQNKILNTESAYSVKNMEKRNG